MTRILWTIAFLAVAVGVARAQTYPAADVRWRLRIHAFFSSGLQFIELPETYATEEICTSVGDKRTLQFKVVAVAYCYPVHTIANEGKIYT